MAARVQIRCKCGRIAQTILRNTGEEVCWEGYIPENPTAWKARYPRDQKPRHERIKDETKTTVT